MPSLADTTAVEGILIFTIEGIDASGKATQAKMLVDALKKLNFPTEPFDFPRYQSRTGSEILGLLTGQWDVRCRPIEQVFEINVGDIPPENVGAYIASIKTALAAFDVKTDLIPADRVKVLVRDPKEDYVVREKQLRALVLQSLMTINRLEVFDMLKQHAGRPEIHLVLDRYFASGLVYGQADGLPLDYLFGIHKALPPSDLWIYVDIPPEESVKRRPERRDEYETRAGFMEKVAAGYMELFRVAIPNKPGGKWVVVDGLGTPDEVHQRIFAEVRKVLGLSEAA